MTGTFESSKKVLKIEIIFVFPFFVLYFFFIACLKIIACYNLKQIITMCKIMK